MKKYKILYGESENRVKKLRGIKQVAKFIVKEGKSSDVEIYSKDCSLYISTFGMYLHRITDSEYREALLKVLIPLQKKVEKEAGIDECDCNKF